MKFGIRKPSLKKSLKARTTGRLKRTVKSSINPLYGKKGMGWINNPEKALYNKVYHKTTQQAIKLESSSKYQNVENSSTDDYQTSPEDAKNGCLGCGGCFGFLLLFLFFASSIDKFIVLPILGEKYTVISSVAGLVLSGTIVISLFNFFKNVSSDPEETENLSEETRPINYDTEVSYQQIVRRTEPTKESGNHIQLFHQTIPQEIFDLLWFSDGPFQNFYPTNYKRYDFEFFTANVRLTPDEPSAISMELPLSKEICSDRLDYFPSYKRLSPAQRYTYLNWLRDITQPIDIGYVFVFYYGLERHILFGNTDRAIRIIYQLKLHHNNASFQNYSNNAIILASMINKTSSWLDYLNANYLNPMALALLKSISMRSFTADDIINFRKKVGYTNDRYIKLHYEIYRAKVMQVIYERYGDKDYPISKEKIATIRGTFILNFANYSFTQDQSSLLFPNVLSGKIQSDLLDILNTAHERTKEGLRESRKKGNSLTS